MVAKTYGFYAREGMESVVWIIGYRGCMGYGMHFPENQLGGLKRVWGIRVWGIREYGLSRPWITRESTVPTSLSENLEFFLHRSISYIEVPTWKTVASLFSVAITANVILVIHLRDVLSICKSTHQQSCPFLLNRFGFARPYCTPN